jgi:hypothetical protein
VPDQADDRARRDVVQLRATRFVPDTDDNDSEQDQDERDCRKDNRDQRGKHQPWHPLLML